MNLSFWSTLLSVPIKWQHHLKDKILRSKVCIIWNVCFELDIWRSSWSALSSQPLILQNFLKWISLEKIYWLFILHWLQCRIHQFFGGPGFSMSVARRKTVVQLGSWGGTVSHPQWGPRAKPQKFLLFCILNSSKHCSHGSVPDTALNLRSEEAGKFCNGFYHFVLPHHHD